MSSLFKKVLQKSLAQKIRMDRRFYTWYYRNLFSSFGEGSVCCGRMTVYRPEVITVGKHCTMNQGVFINGWSSINIGNHVRISPNVSILAVGLNVEGVEPPYQHYGSSVIIEDSVWLAEGCKIMPGVTVGAGALVGAGSLVVADVPPKTVVGGIPAKIIRRLN